MFAWIYKNLKSIPLELAQHCIKLVNTISPTHQARYNVNLTYAAIIKQNINKLLTIGFIKVRTYGRKYLVITNSGSSQEEWKVYDMCRLHKTKCSHKEILVPITFYK